MLAFAHNSDMVPVTSSGWEGGLGTSWLNTETRSTLLWRRVQSGEPGSYTFSKTNTHTGWTVIIVGFTGFNPSILFRNNRAGISSTTSSCTVPALVAAAAGSIQVSAAHHRGGTTTSTTTLTPTSGIGYTTIANLFDGNNGRILAAWRRILVDGDQASHTWTSSTSAATGYRCNTVEVVEQPQTDITPSDLEVVNLFGSVDAIRDDPLAPDPNWLTLARAA